MTAQELKNVIDEGINEIQPKITEMNSTFIECYKKGFSTCWRLFTGQDLTL